MNQSVETPKNGPAGDGGLREALTELAKERDSVSGHTPGDYSIRPYELFDLLKAHPATPAVPQPVDREALAKAIHDAACGCDHYGHMVEIEDHEAADIALAVLAGEQEQEGGVEHQTITNPDAVRRCPARGYANEPCIRPDLHDGSHEWREQEQGG